MNCIDCLDRTNGGQFAVGMKFLTTSMIALGLTDTQSNVYSSVNTDNSTNKTNNTTSVDTSSKIFLELMDMYAELGDRIAVQYGGSEAHNKMAGAGGAAVGAVSNAVSVDSSANISSSRIQNKPSKQNKQGELLTSIKRYAFSYLLL